MQRLVDIQYQRNNMSRARGTFRVQGDTLEVFPSYEQTGYRIEWWGDTIERISRFDPLTGELLTDSIADLTTFPASHYVAGDERMKEALVTIEEELHERLAELESQSKLLEAERLRMRTTYDLEMLREVGFCSGIENYSRHIDGRAPGSAPYTLLDYFPDDYLVVIDESHVTVPQLHGMYEGDISRKSTLVEFGFRLPSAIDNRPLRFEEFQERVEQVVYMSATPGPWELKVSERIVQQIVRPTGLIDPEVEIRPTKGQVDDLIEEIRRRTEVEQRVLVTTLTKKMAEDLTDYLIEMGIRVRYLHSEVDTIQRIEIVRDLRLGEFDVLVGINLLREGLDLPEVSLVAILDADKEGFLRSDTSLIQTIGRAARNVDGKVLMYADAVTDSMKTAISETQRRRMIQEAYNTEHGIDPTTIRRRVHDILLSIEEDPAKRATSPRKERRRRAPAAGDAAGGAGAPPARARGGDAPGRQGPPVRIRRPAAGRGRRSPEGAQGPPRGRGRRVNRLSVRATAAWLGPGELIQDAQIVCEGGLVTYAGAATSIESAGQELRVDGFVMPAVADRHVHIELSNPAAVLRGGVTAVRDLAWPPERIFSLADASEMPSFDGPLIRAAGPMLTAPGGYPTQDAWAPPGTGRELTSVRGCDDGRRRAREARRGGDQGVAERRRRTDTLGRGARGDLRRGAARPTCR